MITRKRKVERCEENEDDGGHRSNVYDQIQALTVVCGVVLALGPLLLYGFKDDTRVRRVDASFGVIDDLGGLSIDGVFMIAMQRL